MKMIIFTMIDDKVKSYSAGLVTSTIFFMIGYLLLGSSFPVLGQQFVKTYTPYASCTATPSKLRLNCISRARNSTMGVTPSFYMAGIQDKNVYIGEVTATGTVLQEKLIGVNADGYSLRSMITDLDGNIVIVGMTSKTAQVSFLMKISPALSLVYHRIYSDPVDTIKPGFVVFNDVKEFNQNGLNNTYYVGGSRKRDNTAFSSHDAILLRINKATGDIASTIPTNDRQGSVDAYDALDFPVYPTPPLSPGLYATGTFTHVNSNGSLQARPWMNIHNGGLALTSGSRFAAFNTGNARLFGSSMANDNNKYICCWNGTSGTTNPTFNTTGLTVLSPTLGLLSQRLYSPAPSWGYTSWTLNKVAVDPQGYVAEGNLWNSPLVGPEGGFVGEMLLLRTNKMMNVVWCRKIAGVYVNNTTHNSAFVIDGNFIYAVGYKKNALAQEVGALVKIPLADGMMDLQCAPVLKVNVMDINYIASDPLTSSQTQFDSKARFNPVNCLQTRDTSACDSCTGFTTMPSAGFTLGHQYSNGTNNFTVNAVSFASAPNSRWIVSHAASYTPNAPDIAASIVNSAPSPSGSWGTVQNHQFGGYNGAPPYTGSTENGSGTGVFPAGQVFRFRHILSQTNSCGITKSDTAVQMLSTCQACKGVKHNMTESSSTRGNIISSKPEKSSEQREMSLHPNPVNRSAFTVQYFTESNHPVTIKVLDMQGKQMLSKQFTSSGKGMNNFSVSAPQLANGTYNVVVINEENTTTQKLVVAK